MELINKKYLILFFILLSNSSFIIQGQDLHLYSGKTTHFGNALNDTSKKRGDNLSNFPFQIGIDIGAGIPNKDDQYVKWIIIGYFDINILERVVFLDIEAGRAKLNQIEGTKLYGSLGLKLNLIKFYNNRIIFQWGLYFYHQMYPNVFVSAKYMYCINKLFGITTSVRLPLFGNYVRPLFSIGVQFFTN